MKRGILSLLVLCALIAGCGQKGDSTGSEVSTTSKTETSGWTVVSNEKAGISLKVPKGWTAFDMSSGELNARLDALSKDNPALAQVVPQIKGLAANGMYKMFIVHTEAATADSKFNDNVNVVATEVPPSSTLDGLTDGSMTGIAQSTGAPTSALTKESAKVAGLDCRIVKGQFDLKLPGGTVPVAMRVFHFMVGGQLVAVTGSASAERMPEVEQTFRDIAETLKVK